MFNLTIEAMFNIENEVNIKLKEFNTIIEKKINEELKFSFFYKIWKFN